MAVRREAAELIKAGFGPIEVGKRMAKSVQDLVSLLLLQVGEGELRLSDVFISIPASRRRTYEHILSLHQEKGQFACEQSCRARGLDVGEFHLYWLTRLSLHNDMYGYLREIELALHDLVRRVLEKAYSSHDDDWWYEGVPERIRVECVRRREIDPQHYEAYAYTMLIDLKEIIEKNWQRFVELFPKEAASKKKEFLHRFDRLNEIRNGVMHPIKPIEIKEDDFRFVRDFRRVFVPQPNATNRDVAQWMVKRFRENGELDQRDAAQTIADTFGPAFVFTNPNGNLAINEDVLAHFRRMTRDEAVWVQSRFCWRRRRPTDPKGERSVE